MKTLTILFLMSFSAFGEDFAKAPYIGFVSLGYSEGSWHRDWQNKLIKPVVKFYSNGELKGEPKFILNKAEMHYQDFIKKHKDQSQVQNFNASKDYSYLVVREETKMAVRVGENFWINKKDVYYFPITGEKFRKKFNAVKIPPKGFYEEPIGKLFYPKKAIEKLRKRHGDAVVDFNGSTTIDGVIWLGFTNFDKDTYGDQKGESWDAWIPAFDEKGEPLFYFIGY